MGGLPVKRIVTICCALSGCAIDLPSEGQSGISDTGEFDIRPVSREHEVWTGTPMDLQHSKACVEFSNRHFACTCADFARESCEATPIVRDDSSLEALARLGVCQFLDPSSVPWTSRVLALPEVVTQVDFSEIRGQWKPPKKLIGLANCDVLGWQYFERFASLQCPDVSVSVHEINDIGMFLYRLQTFQASTNRMSLTIFGVIEESGKVIAVSAEDMSRHRGLCLER